MNLQNSKTYQNLLKGLPLLGLVGIFAGLIGIFVGIQSGDPRPVYSWLMGFTVWFSISIGMLFLTMMFNVFDTGWGIIIRRQTEHAISSFPVLALAFVPLLLVGWFSSDPGILWEWMDPEQILPGAHTSIAEDPIYQGKAGYLNLPFFTLRAIAYFTIFIVFSKRLRKHSFQMDVDADRKHVIANRVYSALGLPIIALTTTFAVFDFLMSLSYQWFSTMFGVWFFATSMRAALATLVLILAAMSTKGYLKGVFKQGHLYLLGCMFLAFTVFWAYISFSQYFLIYNASIPEETFWYHMRELTASGDKSSWWYLSIICMIFGYFFIPFIGLLFYKTKVILNRMVFVSAWILTFFLTDIYFNLIPVKYQGDNVLGYVVEQFSVTFWDISVIIGIGSLCAWRFLASMTKAQPIPIHDPRIQESLHTHE